jgi:ABC-type phosphate transport system auxiliary subunit
VIDSEGIGALDENAEHDARIFSLTILLSSCFIYNSTGSIDENALQNLNLIVSITKNIHLKSKGNEEVDAEEYSQYFPSFLWVVRDFSLQLVDEDNEKISPKEYLENALQQQKGFSEGVENKNRIRRMIQSFFKERDCFTMIRPLLDEKNLQNLQNMEMDQMRPDFVEQVLNLRKRIMGKARVKTLNGKPLSGFMLASLLQSYVTSINEGAVPNIESAWYYICKTQCSNSLQAAFNEYEELMKESLQHSWPISEDYLSSIHKECKEQAVKSYKRTAVGEYKEHFQEELENKIAEKLNWIEGENKRDFEKMLSMALVSHYAKIEKKISNGDYKEFFDYEKDVRNLQLSFYDMEPSGPNKDQMISDFLLKKMPESVYSFINNLKKELNDRSADFERMKTKLESEIISFREENIKEKNKLQANISDLESSKEEIKVHLQCVMENLQQMKKDKDDFERALKEELQTERSKARSSIQELQSQVDSFKESNQTNERNIILLNSEHEKEMALISQKLSFYEQNDKSYSQKGAKLFRGDF